MLDRRFTRDNPEAVRTAVRVKGIDLNVDELLSLHDWQARRASVENYQTKDQKVRVPQVLQPYLCGRTEL